MPDLWPDEITTSGMKAPATILKEQASYLGEKTNNLVRAYVLRIEAPPRVRKDDFGYGFALRAPALDDYRYRLFTIWHSIVLYPVTFDVDQDIFEEIGDYKLDEDMTGFLALTEEDMLDILSRIFRSQKTTRIIDSLIAQSGGLDQSGEPM